MKKILCYIISISLLCSVFVFVDMPQVKAWYYPFVRSYYINNLSSTTMQNLGYNSNSDNIGGAKIILAFGAPTKYNGVYGATCFGSSSVSTSTIAAAVANFITGYNNNPAHTQNVALALGTSNSIPNNTNYRLNPANNDYYFHGIAWANMAAGISHPGKISRIDVACDIELNWNTVTNSKNWVYGVNDSGTSVYMYNFGDNAGNYDVNPYDPNGMYSNTRSNGWTTSDVYDVSYGISCTYAMPQIYFDQTTPHTYASYAHQNNQWWHVALWAFNSGMSMYFAGLISQDGLLWDYNGGYTASLTADASYNSFLNELAKDSRTSQTGFSYPVVLQ